MSDPAEPAAGDVQPPHKEDPETFVLRGRPRPVIRFRKSVIVGGTALFALTVSGLAFLALKPPTLRSIAAWDDHLGERNAPRDALAKAPGSYAQVPRLGPPLPGDLGRPIIERQRQLGTSNRPPPVTGAPMPPAMPMVDPQRAGEEAALRAPLLVERTGAGDRAAVPAGSAPPEATAGGGGGDGVEQGALRPTSVPAGPLVAAGSIIPASLITGLSSDVPGTVIAQVTENVRDSVTGMRILIPRGSRLIGSYDSRTVQGQKRLFLQWERLLLPDGSSLDLGKMAATDSSGTAGLRDRVDGHGWELLKGVVLASLVGVGSELSIDGGGLAGALREALQQNGSKAGEQIVGRALDIRPTLTVRPGWPVRVLVTHDLQLPEWSGPWWR